MSWIAKVSHIADHAENLLNQIDQNAAVVLRNTKKDKSGSTMCLVDIESQGINKLQKPRSEIVEAPTVRTGPIYSISDRSRSKKKDDELIAYLNNSNEPTSSRCSSAASYFSAPNPQIANNVGTTSELCTTEEYLKAQYSDTLKCLHVKESQIAVMSVRLQEVEEANTKKDVQIAELDKELKLMKEELEAEYNGITNDLKKLQREHNKEKEEFEKREQDYVKRLKSANNENSETEQELQKLRTKILKMEMNEQNLVEEIRLAKYNLEANKHEFDEYKQRAQKILSAKENLLTSLKENSSAGSNGVTNSIELEELRCELDLLKDDLQQSQFLIYNLKGDIQEMENKLRDEQRVSGIQRENLLKQIDHHLSQANQCREQMERTQLKYDFLQAEMNRQEEAVERKLAEKDIELMKLIEKTKANKRYEIGEMEQKISLLSEKLISKQTVIEKIESEKRALELRLERAEYACRNAEIAATKAIVIEMRRNSVNSSDRNYSLFAVLHSDNMFIRSAKLAASIFDHLGLHLAIFVRNPVFRFFFFMYCILLHTWTVILPDRYMFL
ncbi:Golgin subfamily A member [Dirofilaria immitis]